MKLKKILVILIVAVLLLPQSSKAYAQTQDQSAVKIGEDFIVTPMWTNVNDITLLLGFKDGKAHCHGDINGFKGTTSISATFKLERKIPAGWSHVKTWTASTNSDFLSFYDSHSAIQGYRYRFSVTATVVRNGISETVSASVEGDYN